MREVRLPFLEVVRLEQTATLSNGRRENRGVDAEETTLVKEIVDRLLDLIPDQEDRALPIAAEPEVPVIEEEIDSVLLRLYRIVQRTRADDLEVGDGDLESARRPSIRAHFAANRHRRLQGQ